MGYEFPDAREAFWQLCEELGISPAFHLQVDFAERLPTAHILSRTPVEEFLSRQDRIQVDVYGEGEAAEQSANALKLRAVGANLWVEGVGLLDEVVVELAPHDLPYSSDRINVSSAVYRVTTRPK